VKRVEAATAIVAAALLLPAAVPAAPAPQAHVTRWAYLLRPAPARAAPTLRASVVTVVGPATPEGESNLVRILEERKDGRLQEWVRVDLAIRPNGTTGWVPRDALGDIRAVRTRLVIDRDRRTATLFRADQAVFRAAVGIGTARYPTPAGTFTVRERLAGFDDPFYGPIAFGTTARSPVLTDWPGGGFVGIHGTNRPDLIPGRVSHGCVRLRNADILRLAALMPVGTPVTIR
jgi:lipoprotein-anchoring transpeptidase ErfK/SrfK